MVIAQAARRDVTLDYVSSTLVPAQWSTVIHTTYAVIAMRTRGS